ncbi:unnamed protein product [Anisakis simplex]|uniref:Activin_recp domain-containing protein n=1 Tax=Anisakis simplex TaxID=6269 RepID=A0A0M3K2H9_ANISI|nr:unnamed protein product [Anisakis simplex]
MKHCRRHKLANDRVHLVGVDKDGREYVNCVKSVNGSQATVALPSSDHIVDSTVYLIFPVIQLKVSPQFEDMRVGCYVVWDVKKQLVVQDCWVQQAISMNNCEDRRCVAKKSTFCCCYGHGCNEEFNLSNNLYESL